jgi:hypothetical protein
MIDDDPDVLTDELAAAIARAADTISALARDADSFLEAWQRDLHGDYRLAVAQRHVHDHLGVTDPESAIDLVASLVHAEPGNEWDSFAAATQAAVRSLGAFDPESWRWIGSVVTPDMFALLSVYTDGETRVISAPERVDAAIELLVQRCSDGAWRLRGLCGTRLDPGWPPAETPVPVTAWARS